ncbi:nuclear transport factor 2 family protein (plasmid) [Paracoccus sp. TK19116]|uniref:Nuclear transport factor 2 family protein n=1 Tax=Paracoccus albicereus TaxID=2922394 RepID=A0ABT1MQQ9_9RHOB|nr:ketosteroid isomerase-related protein [Paracoccus albicereus]MCQ0969256.1 nuclear transport factor 2 family protein [Paracoccus albicereus]
MDPKSLIAAYFDAFNAGRTDEMLDLLHDEVEHHVNEGKIRRGKALFAEFNDHMTESYRENLTDLVIFVDDSGTRAAAEFVVNGTYLKTDPGLPEANGQTYSLPAGSFFTLRDGKIARVTTYYNLADWTAQVSA